MLQKTCVCRPEIGPKHFDNLKPESGPKPAPTYNSEFKTLALITALKIQENSSDETKSNMYCIEL